LPLYGIGHELAKDPASGGIGCARVGAPLRGRLAGFRSAWSRTGIAVEEELMQASGAEAIVEFQDDSGTPIIKIAGEVDMSNAALVREAVDLVIAHDPERVVFDLGELQFMDSSGLAMLLGFAERIAVVELRRPLPLIRRIIELTGLSSAFVIAC
jgi:anti-anti-sigma factor